MQARRDCLNTIREFSGGPSHGGHIDQRAYLVAIFRDYLDIAQFRDADLPPLSLDMQVCRRDGPMPMVLQMIGIASAY